MEKKNSKVDLLLVCETFLDKNTVKLANLPGYDFVNDVRTHSKGGGTGIFIRRGISYKTQKNLCIFDEKLTESTFIEIALKKW